eukprot:3088975-Rhodomonas_salina.2
MLSTSLLPELSADDESQISRSTPWKSNATRNESALDADAKVQILSPAHEMLASDLDQDEVKAEANVDDRQTIVAPVLDMDRVEQPPFDSREGANQAVIEATVEVKAYGEFTVEELVSDDSGMVSGEVGFLGSSAHASLVGRRLLGGQFVPLGETPHKRPALLRMSRSSVGQIFSSPVAAEFATKDDDDADEKRESTEPEMPEDENHEHKLTFIEEQLRYWEEMAKLEGLGKKVAIPCKLSSALEL